MDILTELNDNQKKATQLLVVLCGLLTFLLLKDSTIASIALGVLVSLALRNTTLVYALAHTIRRDAVAGHRFLMVNLYIAYVEYKGWTIARIFQERVRKHPHKTCFTMDERKWSFQQVEDYTNKVGAYFKSKGMQHGDCVALLMETRPEYVCLWLGLSKIGVITALINNNQRNQTLLHSIKVAKPRAIIVGTESAAALRDVLDDEALKALPIFQFYEEQQRAQADFTLVNEKAIELNKELSAHEAQNLRGDISACAPRDKLLYVYTSGTTGLPKAAVITNLRYLYMASALHHMFALHTDDVIYNPLPLYHSAGGIVGVGNALIHGCTLALRKKFSASNFWKDCIKHDCTVAQYIGELCRYLLSRPPQPEDKKHRIRMMFGNGLRPQIWSQFMSRFNIPQMAEIYGSTEGNSNLANVTNQVGAVGFTPVLGSRLFPVQIIKCDEETGEPIRNHMGYCVRCKPGETGLLVGQVNPKRAVTAFHGYADKASSEKKLLCNVFRKDDVYFNSGDMVVSDIFNYLYFKDRTGDTFRWRGENVSTLEVEAIITNLIGLQDCVVYGVEIPHVEGKAGMAAIADPQRIVDFAHLSTGIRGSLPAYAQPLFIRLMKELPHTTTLKLKKNELSREAFSLEIEDPIYYLNKDGVYRPLTVAQYDSLLNGNAGL